MVIDVPTSFQDKLPGPCACTSVKKLSRVLGRVYDAALAHSPINVTQLAVLCCIDRRKGEPLMHVAVELEMDRSSLYRALDPMVRDEWVKIRAGTDARSRTAVITSKGYRVLAEGGRQWNKVQARVVERFGRREWSAFAAQVDRFRKCAADLEEAL